MRGPAGTDIDYAANLGYRISKKGERSAMQISQFFLGGDIKGAIAYMRDHEDFKDILPAYVAIFEDSELSAIPPFFPIALTPPLSRR